MKRIAYFGLTLALSMILLGVTAVAQTPATAPDQTPLGDYARKIQKNSGAAAAKPKPKVFDNDNLPTTDKLSIVGAQPPANAADTTPPDADKAATAAKPDDDQAKKQAEWKSWKNKISGQKDSIDLASRELDVLQREYQLRAAAMYADAGNRLRNELPWDKQEAEYKQKIADKQKAVEDAKQKLEDMQEEARKAGVPSSMLD